MGTKPRTVTRFILGGLLLLGASGLEAQWPSWGPSQWNQTGVPEIGQIPDYVTFHTKAKHFATPCDVDGPADWRDLCDQMVLNLAATLATVTPSGSDLVMVIQGGALKLSTVTGLGVAGGAAGAPADAQYVVAATNGTLSAERVGTSSTSITWDYATTGQAIVKRAALTGDITAGADSNVTALASNAVASVNIADGSVALADMADVATNTIFCRDTTGTGVPEICTLGASLDFTSANVLGRAALTGDVTASANSNATTIAAGVVTLAKMADVATNTIFCRDTTGTGVPEICTLGASLDFTSANVIGRAALTGDVTASANSNATTIANSAVTLAKMADLATDTLIGRQSGTGAPEAISASGGIEWTTNAIQRSALTGDVTASAGSNATTIAAAAVTIAKTSYLRTVKLTGNLTRNTSSPGDLTGILFTVTTGHYYQISCNFIMSSADTTVGMSMGATFPAMTIYHVVSSLPQGAQGVDHYRTVGTRLTGDMNTATAMGDTNDVVYQGFMEGVMIPSADGTWQARWSNETGSAVVTMYQGSSCRMTELP